MRPIARPVALASASLLAVGMAAIFTTSSQADVGDISYVTLETNAQGAVLAYEDAEVELTPRKNCSIDANEADTSFADLTSNGTLGFNDNGFGVRAKGPGSNCGQIAGDQTVTFSLDSGDSSPTANKLITRAEVDIEAKFACEATVDYYRDGEFIGSENLTLSERSDCGPDSGGNDNWRAVLTTPGAGADEIVFKAAGDGAISIEGGAESTALEGGVSEDAGTNGSAFELVEGGRLVIPEDGAVIIQDPSGAVAYVENVDSTDDLDIPYETEPCEGDEPGEPCVNFKLITDDFYLLRAYVSIPIGAEGAQETWDGEIDFGGNSSGNTFTLGDLTLGDGGCQIDPEVAEQQACITGFFFPDPLDGTGNPALADASGSYRTDVWDLWLNDPRLR